jgi:Methyltransferase domain
MVKYIGTADKVKSVTPNSSSNTFRQKRFAHVARIINGILAEKDTCHILDIGGTAGYWATYANGLQWTRLCITTVNVTYDDDTSHPDIAAMIGDGRDLGRLFEDQSFDLVHSNSVIEHVGKWNDMIAMSQEVRRVGRFYFVQAPYFWFPIEPHFRLPFFHWLPEPVRCQIVMRRAAGYFERQPDIGHAVSAVQSAVLPDRAQMQYLFPDATIIHEKWHGLTKSLMAIRGPMKID